jgi:flagellar protein FlaG
MDISAINSAGSAQARPNNSVRTDVPISAKASETETNKVNEKKTQPEALESAVEKVQKFISTTTSDVQFSIEANSGDAVVKVIDRATKELIRQIPSSEMLAMAQALDRLQGVLVKQQA